ncbi:MAG: hypothetical protein Q4D34_06885 [Eggerthellaceae bacterium]|nr:hypothetical protein [Eggerthellaceae bacterium]
MARTSIEHITHSILSVQHALGQAKRDRDAEIVETKLFIGLNDAETKTQKFDVDQYVSVLNRVCVEYGVPFSFDVINGGYIHDDGEYTEENTIELSFINIEKKTVDRIAQDLCTFFNQESVLITEDRVKVRSVCQYA